MLEKSLGLFLKKIPYGDHSAVLSIFTPHRGLITFMGRNLHGKSAKNALFEPGRFLEIVYFYQNNKNFQQLKDARILKDFSALTLSPTASQVLQFCTEVVYLSVKEGHADDFLFELVKEQFALLCSPTCNLAWFPQSYLIKLAQVQGFTFPSSSNGKWGVHLESGQTISAYLASGSKYLLSAEIDAIEVLSKGEIPQMDKKSKSDFTEKLIKYTEKHVLGGQEIKSYPILKELMND